MPVRKKASKPLLVKLDSGITDRRIVLPDTHGILVDPQALECVLQAIEILRPRGVIHLGDVGEWEALCLHNYKRFKQLPQMQELARCIRSEADQMIGCIINPIDEACARSGVEYKTVITGNHDARTDHFVDANPDYETLAFGEATGYRFKDLVAWGQRGWKVHPVGELFNVGKLHFYHGHLYGGVNHTRNHLMQFGDNIMYGHWHDVSYSSKVSLKGPIGAWSMGCLKRLDFSANTWLERRPTNWGQAFAVVDWWGKEGFFTVHAINIIEGQCSLITNQIDGRKPRRALLEACIK